MLKLEISSPDSTAPEFEEEFRRLYLDLKADLDEGSIERYAPEAVAEHRDPIVIPYLVLKGISLFVFPTIFEALKVWLAARPRRGIKLTFPDGSVAEVTGLSPEGAIKMLAEHSEKFAPADAGMKV